MSGRGARWGSAGACILRGPVAVFGPESLAPALQPLRAPGGSAAASPPSAAAPGRPGALTLHLLGQGLGFLGPLSQGQGLFSLK